MPLPYNKSAGRSKKLDSKSGKRNPHRSDTKEKVPKNWTEEEKKKELDQGKRFKGRKKISRYL